MPQERSSGFSPAYHMGISVRNLEKSIAFCEGLTGVKVANIDEIGGPRFARTQGLADTRIRYANLHLDNLNMDMLEYVLSRPEKASYQNNQISAMHLCFEVDDVDTAMERQGAIGVEPEGDPIIFQKEDGLKEGLGTAVAYFRNPDGTNLEIVAPRGPFKRRNL